MARCDGRSRSQAFRCGARWVRSGTRRGQVALVRATAYAQADRLQALYAQIDRIYKDNEYALPRFGPARWLDDGTIARYSPPERTFFDEIAPSHRKKANELVFMDRRYEVMLEVTGLDRVFRVTDA